MSYESTLMQIKELDSLYVQANQTQDPKLWDRYNAKVREFEESGNMIRTAKTESKWMQYLQGKSNVNS